MTKKFSEFKSNNSKENMQQNIYDVVNDYAVKSPTELMDEFLELSKRKKLDGSLNATYINNIKDKIFPYLTQEQQQKFYQLMDEIK